MSAQARHHVRERVDGLPGAVWRCEACSTADAMQIRRSSLRPEPCADDVMLKCGHCYRIRTHGIPITREAYETERAMRERRVLDFVEDGPDSVDENLAALGYIDY